MYERDEFLRDRIRPHQPGTPRGYSPRPPSGDRCPAPPPGRHAAAATPPGPPRLPSAPLRPLPDPAWPRQPEAPPPSTWADPALAPIRSRTRPGERGWRRMVRLVTFGLVGLGRSGMQRQEAQFEATIRTVLHGNHKVAVLGKGGVGKTSVAACVGSILAELRQQDRIVGIDADTAFGRLSSRIDPRAAGSFWELTTDTNLRSFTDITARLGRNSAGLYVLAGQPAIRSAPGARSGHLPRSRPKVGSPFRNLGDRLRFLHGGGGHPGSIARCGCSDRGVLALGGWCLRWNARVLRRLTVRSIVPRT